MALSYGSRMLVLDMVVPTTEMHVHSGVVHSLHTHSGLYWLPTHEQKHCREMLMVFMLKEEDVVHEP